jgi:hypothetical protein
MIPGKPLAAPSPVVPLALPKLLLVEGDTPMHFFEAFLRHLTLDNQVEIRNFRGTGDFKQYLLALVSRPEFNALVTSVGVVRDAADKPAASARQSIADALSDAGLTPARVRVIRTSIFILPDDTNPGMIETLCMEAVKNEPTLADPYACVEEFFACLARNNVSLPSQPVLAKHRAQAYLATRTEAQMFPGIAGYRGYWPWDNPVFQPLRQFLLAL